MMPWPWWWGALALSAIPIAHWLLLKRALAVSGRISGLVDGLRAPREPELDVSSQELLRALRAQTAEAFGEAALDEVPVEPLPAPPSHSGPLQHGIFLGGLMLGGLLSVLLGEPSVALTLRGEGFASLTTALGVPAPLLLALAGVLVGFGTRMAAGCTSGHGLCGVSQLQAGSLLSTAAFFGAGAGTSFVLSLFLGGGS